jgi:mRNA interferase RelE/StbE
MQFTDTRKFRKNLLKLPKSAQLEILDALDTVHAAEGFSDIPNFKPLKGAKNYYRIRVGDWRIGLYWNNGIFQIEDVGKRGDFYKHYP